jgi:hypothetical protein
VLAEDRAYSFNRGMEPKSTSGTKSGAPVEIWLTQQGNGMQIACMVVEDDESTRAIDVKAWSMRGAQREVTGWLKRQGYHPAGRWLAEGSKGLETVRHFRKPAGAVGNSPP